MPTKNRIKNYLEDGYYHIYNRGVEKRVIFQDEQDYAVFLSYLKDYLLPKNEQELLSKLADPNTSYKEKDKINKLLRLNNFTDEITLLAYCLMPNHFHFLVQQKNASSIDKFMNSFCTRYTMYFNKKHKRVGSLYQDVYKAILVETDEQFVYLTKYIHQQALASQGLALRGCPSSYSEYLGTRKTEWVKPDEILKFFTNSLRFKNNPSFTYKAFIEEKEDFELINKLMIDD